MNSIHEPGPNGDSETLPSRKTRSKTKPGARAPKLAQLGTQAIIGAIIPGRVVGATAVWWPSCPVMSRPAWPYRNTHARASCPAPQRRVAAPQRPCRSAPVAVSQALLCAAGRVVGLAVHFIATQCSALPLVFQLAAVTIQCLYRDPACLPSQVSCNTLPHSSCLKLSQYTNFIATHFPVKPVPQSQYNSLYLDTAHQPFLQYNPKSCNTIPPSQYKLGNSKFPNFCIIFFSFFIINIFFSLFPATKKKPLKSFFFFLGHSNKFIKIYFTPFSSILLLVKS